MAKESLGMGGGGKGSLTKRFLRGPSHFLSITKETRWNIPHAILNTVSQNYLKCASHPLKCGSAGGIQRKVAGDPAKEWDRADWR